MARTATSRKVGTKENFFGFLTDKKVTYHRDVAKERRKLKAEHKTAADRKKREDKEHAAWQIGVQKDYAYETGARHKREGKKSQPSSAVTVAAIKELGKQKAGAIARSSYMAGYRQNPAVSGPQYRLAQAVLAGTARSKATMSKKVAQELVDRTPHNARVIFSAKRNYDPAAGKYAVHESSGRLKEILESKKEAIALAKKIGGSVYRNEPAFNMGRGPRRVFQAKRNPAADAAALSKKFHGRKATTQRQIVEKVHSHEHLMEIGPLVRLVIDTPTGLVAVLNFNTSDAKKIVYLASSERDPKTGKLVGKQLYLRGGDQEVNLAGLKMDSPLWIRDLMELGRLHEFKRGDPALMVNGERVKGSITYRTRKGIDNFELIDYWHKAGEETGGKQGMAARPLVLYDYRNKKLQLAGGQYKIDAPGIIN